MRLSSGPGVQVVALGLLPLRPGPPFGAFRLAPLQSIYSLTLGGPSSAGPRSCATSPGSSASRRPGGWTSGRVSPTGSSSRRSTTASTC